MRRKDRQTGGEAALALLKKGVYGIAATAGDAYPSGTPLNYACDEEGTCLFFHTARQGSLPDNLKANGRICFTVVGEVRVVPAEFACNYESVMAHGTVEIADGEDKRRGLLLLCEKYSPAFLEAASAYIEKEMAACTVYKMKIEQLRGKSRSS
jgi:nitroimidazol reductase NimA-like FMN-containing flavoprotein (pyridoxamine 5'-phosphate oxidase superfamily)